MKEKCIRRSHLTKRDAFLHIANEILYVLGDGLSIRQGRVNSTLTALQKDVHLLSSRCCLHTHTHTFQSSLNSHKVTVML